MKKLPYSLIIAGPARNAEPHLPGLLEGLDEIRSHFAESYCLFVEGGSTDRTRAILRLWAEEEARGEVIALPSLDAVMPQRTARIAYARNRFLSRIESDSQLSKFDYLLVVDLDEVNLLLNAEAVLSCFDTPTDSWDAMMANQHHLYYDLWALRQKQWCDGDCWGNIWGRPPFMSREQAQYHAIHSRMIALSEGAAPVPVESAFGGAGLYRLSRLLGCRYKGLNSGGWEVCDHVHLHESFRKRGGRIFINPRMINSDGLSLRTKWARKQPPHRRFPSAFKRAMSRGGYRLLASLVAMFFGIPQKKLSTLGE